MHFFFCSSRIRRRKGKQYKKRFRGRQKQAYLYRQSDRIRITGKGGNKNEQLL